MKVKIGTRINNLLNITWDNWSFDPRMVFLQNLMNSLVALGTSIAVASLVSSTEHKFIAIILLILFETTAFMLFIWSEWIASHLRRGVKRLRRIWDCLNGLIGACIGIMVFLTIPVAIAVSYVPIRILFRILICIVLAFVVLVCCG